MSDDTISRKATIEAMEGVDWYHIDSDGQLTHGANSEEHEPLYKAKDVYTVLNTMPSAQPEVLACGECELIAQPEIVRCEDCRHWEQETFNDGYCIEMDLRMCDADFYCGYAERRTDEGD